MIASKNMNVPKTSSGKPCKLCLKKGSTCHLHKSSPRSPKKSSPSSSLKRSPNTKSGSFDSALGSHKKRVSSTISPKRSSPKIPTKFEYINDLPLPALQEVLLNMDREELNKLCSMNKRAKRICDENNFRMMYNARNLPPLVKGELEEIDYEETGWYKKVPKLLLRVMLHHVGEDYDDLEDDAAEIEGLRFFRDTKNPKVYVGQVDEDLDTGIQPIIRYYSNSIGLIGIIETPKGAVIRFIKPDVYRPQNFLEYFNPEWGNTPRKLGLEITPFSDKLKGDNLKKVKEVGSFFLNGVKSAIANAL